MAQVVSDIKKINFLMSSIAVIFPDGQVVSIEKIRGFNYHIEYLRLLFKSDNRIKEILKNTDLSYYVSNPSDVLNDIIPIFNEKGCAVYMNLNPNTIKPTNYAIIFLPNERTKGMDNSFKKLKNKFLPVCFGDGIVYNTKTKEFESFMPSNISLETPNSDVLYDFIENKNSKDQLFHLG